MVQLDSEEPLDEGSRWRCAGSTTRRRPRERASPSSGSRTSRRSGCGCVDAATGAPVSHDVTVTLFPPRLRASRSSPCRTPSGVFAAHGLPVARAWELRDVGPDGEPVDVVADPAVARVEVVDSSGRFFSFAIGGRGAPDGRAPLPVLRRVAAVAGLAARRG